MTPRVFRIFVPVNDAATAVPFYQTLFGHEGRDVHRGRHYFDCGSVIVAVVQNSGPPIADHIYFAVSDLEDVYQRARGLNCLERSDVHGAPSDAIAVRPWGERSFYARDPSGNGLCFVDESTLFTGA